ncbi:MAG: helix-turn-helix domain-containing protein [Desulfocapsaceae bacterium]|nr:helix-turn-helix domain-containing protein [Desulfocapsaceae bacterium]
MVKACTTKRLAGREYRCFFELTLQVMGGKWKPIIIYQLAIEGIMRFGELRRSVNGITERMLTRQLRELEKDGLIHRKVYHQVPPKVEYSLLPLGAKLIPILREMREWGVAYESFVGGCSFPETEEQENIESPEIAPMYRQHCSL